MLLTKSIKISEKTHKLLTEICPKKSSYDNIIYDALIQQYIEEELTDEEAEYCNKMIDNLERGNYEDTYEINTEDLDKKLDELEEKGII